MVFVNSMSDLFHEAVPDDYIETVVRVMQHADWHTFQVLTKRSGRMRELLERRLRFAAELPHIWWGVSVENRKHGLPRVSDLRSAPAIVRFLSVEPLLEDLGQLDLRRIAWVIVGGESGAGARPMEKAWALAIRDQCRQARVPFFFKQWGGVRKSAAGRELDGRTYDEFPSRTAAPVADTSRRLAMIAEIEATQIAFDHGPLRAGRVRQSEFKHVFQGRLVPQDARDEPASAVLERLRHEPVSSRMQEGGNVLAHRTSRKGKGSFQKQK